MQINAETLYTFFKKNNLLDQRCTMFSAENIIREFFSQFQAFFNKQSFVLFEMIVLSLLTRYYQDASLVQVWRWQDYSKHWTNIPRFVRCYKWEPLTLSNVLLRFLVRLFKLRELYFVADTTLCERYSWRLPCVFRRWILKFRRYGYAQEWVVVSIVLPRLMARERFRIYGLMAALWDKTKKATHLLEEMLLRLRLPEWCRPYLIVDAGLNSVVPEGWHIITRLRLDARLYGEPLPSRPGKRGRKPLKGKRYYAEKVFYRAKDKVILSYRNQELKVVVRYWRVHQWGYRRALVLICQPVAHPEWRPIVLATTDVEMSPQTLLNLYSARLEIERLFQDVKKNGAFGKYRGKKRVAHERFNNLVLLSQSLKQLIAEKGEITAIDLNEPWRKRKDAYSLSPNQLRRVLEAYHLSEKIMQLLPIREKMQKIPFFKERIFQGLARIL